MKESISSIGCHTAAILSTNFTAARLEVLEKRCGSFGKQMPD
jgi:hypothetical protein